MALLEVPREPCTHKRQTDILAVHDQTGHESPVAIYRSNIGHDGPIENQAAHKIFRTPAEVLAILRTVDAFKADANLAAATHHADP